MEASLEDKTCDGSTGKRRIARGYEMKRLAEDADYCGIVKNS